MHHGVGKLLQQTDL